MAKPRKDNTKALLAKLKANRIGASASQPLSQSKAKHILVNSGAGTGKTFTAEGVCHTLRPNDPVSRKWLASVTPSDEQAAIFEAVVKLNPAWAKTPPKYITTCAFSKLIADELQARMPRGVKAGTLHSIGYGTIKFANRIKYMKVTNWKTKDIVLNGWGRELGDLTRDERDRLYAIDRLTTLCKLTLAGTVLSALESSGTNDIATHADMVNSGIAGPGHMPSPHEILGKPLECCPTDEELLELCDRYAVPINGGRQTVFDGVRESLNEGRLMHRRIDYADMIWMPVINGWKPFRSDLLIVDESQDQNTCQQMFTIMMGEYRMYIGDVNQAIFGFTGSDSRSFYNLRAQCEADGGVTELKLTLTRRCGRAIVEHANQWVEDYHAHENNPDGRVRLSLPMKEFDPKIEDMVLCRTNAPLISQAFKLLADRKPVVIQGRDIGTGLIKLIESFKVDTVEELGPLLDEWHSKEEAKLHRRPRVAETAVQVLDDKVACIEVFMQHNDTIKQMKAEIESIFEDLPPASTEEGKRSTGRIRLSSVHRGKGLEANNVYVIEPQLMPHPLAKAQWEREQEINLQYVACTRAIDNLSYVV